MITFTSARGNKVSLWKKDIKSIEEYSDSYYTDLNVKVNLIDGKYWVFRETHSKALELLNVATESEVQECDSNGCSEPRYNGGFCKKHYSFFYKD